MARKSSKKKTTAATRSAKKNVAVLVKAGEAKKKRGKAAPSAASGEPTGEAPSAHETGNRKPGKQRWKGMSVEQLQARYAETLGRASSSRHAGYLIWKIREAEKGNVPIGPVQRKLFEGPATVVTVKFAEAFLEGLDAAAKDDGFKSRLGYLRDLIGKGLEVRGHSELAAKVGGA